MKSAAELTLDVTAELIDGGGIDGGIDGGTDVNIASSLWRN